MRFACTSYCLQILPGELSRRTQSAESSVHPKRSPGQLCTFYSGTLKTRTVKFICSNYSAGIPWRSGIDQGVPAEELPCPLLQDTALQGSESCPGQRFGQLGHLHPTVRWLWFLLQAWSGGTCSFAGPSYLAKFHNTAGFFLLFQFHLAQNSLN